MEGDTIVMGSDGLFDNVFDHEIVSTVAGHGDVAAAGMSSKIRRTCIWQSTSHFSN
jgi:serine/threonine protein phosphatase PrpC